MDRNQFEIDLLKKDPGKLLLEYQQVIWTIVRTYFSRGMVRYREQEDLVQEINKRLLERMPRIQAQYNYTSKLRTYFSVIIRNICLEINRKVMTVSEPDPPKYQTQEASEQPVDVFLYKQEFERLQKVLLFFHKDHPRLNLLLKILNNIKLEMDDLDLFSDYNGDDKIELLEKINDCRDQIKKRKFDRISQALFILENKQTPSDSLRKWYASRLEECLVLMNGNPPTSSYSADTLGLLLEQINMNKNT